MVSEVKTDIGDLETGLRIGYRLRCQGLSLLRELEGGLEIIADQGRTNRKPYDPNARILRLRIGKLVAGVERKLRSNSATPQTILQKSPLCSIYASREPFSVPATARVTCRAEVSLRAGASL